MTPIQVQPVSPVLELTQRVEALQKEIELGIEGLPDVLALAMVVGEVFKGFNPSAFALFDYRVLDKAFQQKTRTLFQQYSDLLYVTVGFCTDPSESASATGINQLVFGFVPVEHQGARIGSIRDFLLGNEEKCTARERLAFQSTPIVIPAMSHKDRSLYLEGSEEDFTNPPSGFIEEAQSLLTLADTWFEAYDTYFHDETDSVLRFWRDDVTMIRHVWEDFWNQVN